MTVETGIEEESTFPETGVLVNNTEADNEYQNPDPIKVAALEAAVNASITNEWPASTIDRARIFEKYLREA